MTPIGPYSHIAKVNDFITIGGTAGVGPKTGKLVGLDVSSQTIQILKAFEIMLESVNSDLEHVLHINVFLTNMDDFKVMNAAYSKKLRNTKPARTAISVSALPKTGALARTIHETSNSHLSPVPVGNFVQSEIRPVFRSFTKIPYRHRVRRDNPMFHE